MTTRGSYGQKHMVKFLGASQNVLFFLLQFSQIFMVSDKIINKAFKMHKSLQKTSEIFFFFIINQNYTLALKAGGTELNLSDFQ